MGNTIVVSDPSVGARHYWTGERSGTSDKAIGWGVGSRLCHSSQIFHRSIMATETQTTNLILSQSIVQLYALSDNFGIKSLLTKDKSSAGHDLPQRLVTCSVD